MEKINLQGLWNFCLDKDKAGIEKKYYMDALTDNIVLPTTVSEAKKGTPSDERNTGYLTDPYLFEGYTWYSKEIELDKEEDKEYFFIIERTRISHLWIDDKYVGSKDSLCTSHKYEISSFLHKGKHKITIMIDNTSYPVKGGHMTSPDTQTNWNGITGELYIAVTNKVYMDNVQIYSDIVNKAIDIKVTLKGGVSHKVKVYVSDEEMNFEEREYELKEGKNHITYNLDERVTLWSEYTPKLYTLHLDDLSFTFGLREFKAAGKYFEINGIRTFLRGKHDGLIFPLTGYAPTDVKEWIRILSIAKSYGINHYRFHTCTPPEAAFTAADMLGIYMEPELPFWGTVTVEGDENHDEVGQEYLVEEGFRILKEFGNHPSFVMMSMGNELWGSKERINKILGMYRNFDTRHLYTQGSNNFQFMPCILENEDFFCGVRFSRDRLFRGSYAMCDAPLGHIQTMAPNTVYNYDEIIRPPHVNQGEAKGGEITIQYGTGTKKVKMEAEDEIIPHVPVVSHEIGQYGSYPDFSEIEKYTGVLKARNLEVFRERLEEKNMISMADKFFKASSRFAAECYKAEIETAQRSNELAGFQILDLQDFTGQGTALVGILNSFMENKGAITKEEWNQFCSSTVILGELPKHVFVSGETLDLGIKLSNFGNRPISNPKVILSLLDGGEEILRNELMNNDTYTNGLYHLGNINVTIPSFINPKNLVLSIYIEGTSINNNYDIWVYPVSNINLDYKDIVVSSDLNEVCVSLEEGKTVLYYPNNLNENNSIVGTYCTDFWNYPMFRSISESVNKPVPVGTHGLFIEEEHPIFNYFPTKHYSTPQWYDFVDNSRALILDNKKINPIVWTIDNFERNHKLGNIIEAKVSNGKLIICTANLRNLENSVTSKWLEYSIVKYLSSPDFVPNCEIELEELREIFV